MKWTDFLRDRTTKLTQEEAANVSTSISILNFKVLIEISTQRKCKAQIPSLVTCTKHLGKK